MIISYATTPNGIDVGAVVERRIAARLLRRDVGGCAEADAGLGDATLSVAPLGGGERLADPEVEHDRAAVEEHHVLRLDVAVHDAFAVRVRERARYLLEDARDVDERHGPFAIDALAERLAVDERHRVVERRARLTGGQERDDVRMLKPCREADLALEALGAQRSP